MPKEPIGPDELVARNKARLNQDSALKKRRRNEHDAFMAYLKGQSDGSSNM